MSGGVGSYAFRAVRGDGSVEEGLLEALDREAAATLLRARGLFPLEVRPRTLARSRRGPGADDQALGLRALASLLGAGLPLARALDALPALAPPSWGFSLPHVRQRVVDGGGLAEAFSESSLALPPHALGILEAGEADGGLASAVERAAVLLERRAETRRELLAALAYPTLLVAAGTVSVAILVGVVLPRFAAMLREMGEALPPLTRLVLSASDVASAAAPFAAVALVVGLGAGAAVLRRPGGRRLLHRALLGVPALGAVRRSVAAAGACSTLSALLGAGVPLATALPLAGRATGDAELEARIGGAVRRVRSGAALSAALEAEDATTPTVVRLARAGEETGELAAMLDHGGRIESAAAIRTTRGVLRLVEPLTIVAFGGVVLVVAAALLQAMYGLRP